MSDRFHESPPSGPERILTREIWTLLIKSLVLEVVAKLRSIFPY